MSRKRGLDDVFSGPESADDNLSHDDGRATKKAKLDITAELQADQSRIHKPITYHHPILAKLAPILAGGLPADKIRDAIKSELVPASKPKENNTIKLECIHCKEVENYEVKSPPTGKAPWHCTLYLQTSSSAQRTTPLLRILQATGIEGDSCNPSRYDWSPTDANSSELAAQTSPSAGSTTSDKRGSESKPSQDTEVRAGNGRLGFLKYAPPMRFVGDYAKAWSFIAGSAFQNHPLANIFSTFASDKTEVDMEMLKTMTRPQKHQVYACSKSMMNGIDRAMKDLSNVSRNVETNKRIVANYDFAWIERSHLIPEEADEHTRTANTAGLVLQSTPHNDWATKLRVAKVGPIPGVEGTGNFRAWWTFTFSGRKLEDASKWWDMANFRELLKVTSEIDQSSESGAVYFKGDTMKGGYIRVVSEVVSYGVAMAPAEGTMMPESKVFLKACEMRLDRQRHQQYEQDVIASGTSLQDFKSMVENQQAATQSGKAPVASPQAPPSSQLQLEPVSEPEASTTLSEAPTERGEDQDALSLVDPNSAAALAEAQGQHLATPETHQDRRQRLSEPPSWRTGQLQESPPDARCEDLSKDSMSPTPPARGTGFALGLPDLRFSIAHDNKHEDEKQSRKNIEPGSDKKQSRESGRTNLTAKLQEMAWPRS
ncbi:hypothetical protein M409DRAFT_60262 [Zasmidium cellare ATCC 36951]|uniref:Uncharacterized protein n=1 Tax=Zasmidium cellare ATCC 36951 TaxID=1080233 RepID=A0A6A6C343_ZASCE|nr:uncharacterized protein M409DRAFT_60262 [Zasmidium cellare ATCC 36951]KAF2160159.1 hypothetical protein M409DRAFT_60262 [Zasmidium cellare ATCC 36951]